MAAKAQEKAERKVRIILPYDEQAGDVFVSVNARTWLIKRGVEVEVPECVAEVLRERERQIAASHENAEQFKTT